MKNTMLRKSFKIFVKTADWTVKHSTSGYLAGFHLQMDGGCFSCKREYVRHES